PRSWDWFCGWLASGLARPYYFATAHRVLPEYKLARASNSAPLRRTFPFFSLYIGTLPCGSGGTGRRARPRIFWGNTRGGSSPLSPTTIRSANFSRIVQRFFLVASLQEDFCTFHNSPIS